MTDASARIDEIVKSNDVVLFMKGTALFPQCGFSRRAVALLDHLGVGVETVDVLQDPEVRQGIKAYSDWPTVPQLYVKGEFVGGSDILMEMSDADERKALLDEKQLATAYLRHPRNSGNPASSPPSPPQKKRAPRFRG